MKKLLALCILLLLFTADSRAQGMPVYDNTNFISLAKQLIESAKQTGSLLKTVQFLKQQKENLEKVNNVLRQLKAIERLAKNHQELVRTIQNDLQNILDSPFITPEEITQVSKAFDLIIQTSLDDLNFIEQILSSDFLKMSDSDRTLVLQEKELASASLLNEIRHKIYRYLGILAFREMQDQVNNRIAVQ